MGGPNRLLSLGHHNRAITFWKIGISWAETFLRFVLRSRPPFTGVLLGLGPESAPRSAFWAILGTCLGVPQRVLFECFLAFLGPKNAKKHSKSTLWGTPRQVPKIAQKALRGALSGPSPKSTPVNGGRDRKICAVGQQLTCGVVREGVIAENFPRNFREISAPFPGAIKRISLQISANFLQNFRKLSAKKPSLTTP